MLNVIELFEKAHRIPQSMPEFTPAAGRPLPTGEGLSPQAKLMLEAWKPLLDKVDFSKMPGADGAGKMFVPAVRLAMAQMFTNEARKSPAQWYKEATLTGTDVPSYAKQTLTTIMRAYPRLIALQLFGTLPMSGPDARVFYRDMKYDGSAGNVIYGTATNGLFSGTNVGATYSGTPSVAAGDLTSDLTKFNPLYFKVGQGQVANRLKMSITSHIVTADSYRVVSDVPYETEDDFAALYGGSAMDTQVAHQASMLQWTIDRTMINAAVAQVPAASKITWDANPAGYTTLQPTEQRAYQETIWTSGILKVLTAINTKRALSAPANWAICDPQAAEKLMRLTTFSPNGNAYNAIDLEFGAVRDLGTLSAVGIRVLVDPQMAAGTILFGRRPTTDFDPCLSFCPYRPLVQTGVLEQPGIGIKEKGTYTRFAVAQPDANIAASSQLADVYGLLTISNYASN